MIKFTKTRITEYENYNKTMYQAERRIFFLFWTKWFKIGNKQIAYASSSKSDVIIFIRNSKGIEKWKR